MTKRLKAVIQGIEELKKLKWLFYIFGQKKRYKSILLIDDICSYGGTFKYSLEKLKELGAGECNIYVTHCENSVLKGDLINSDWFERIYTTNSIFTGSHDKIAVNYLYETTDRLEATESNEVE